MLFPDPIPPVSPTIANPTARWYHDRERGSTPRTHPWYRTPVRAVAQRVFEASVVVDSEVVGEIGPGLLVFLGAAGDDEGRDVESMANKLAGLRIFRDDDGKMSRSVEDVGGALLIVSQFTLFGDVRRGRRPSFTGAAEPVMAERLYEELIARLRDRGLEIATGRFRAMMDVRSRGDGPVTILIDTKKKF